MSLHPDLAGFLELVEMGRLMGNSQPMHQLSVEQARREFASSSAILDPSPPAALEVTELSIVARDGATLAARLYRGEGPRPAAQPTILYLHGGGYVVGSLDSHDSVCRRLAADGRFAVLAADYRLAPEQRFPTASNDVLDVADWLAAQASTLGLDAARVAVAGDSVGATLATVLALAAQKGETRLAPVAQMLFYPVTDTSRERDSYVRYAEGYLLESATLRWFYDLYLAEPRQRLDWRASPLLIEQLPAQVPSFVSLAGHDPLYDEGLAWAERLQASGTEVTLDLQPQLTHDFLRMSGMVPEVQGIYDRALEWLFQRC
ncbi:alpha/beta hydrolase [Pseudomonas entomophila]|uniref:Alpha/beta hydrolase n=2 Tax=Pseudomonas entomophila TaxID=312306 RepID=A0ABY9QX22_9PSED|nr:alpha/beta hydrolase [Pseudomonas entomophila]WMW08241.1 alpha/beta hydrolase [Pseudomonas entomophila]CAK15986.1 putative lipase [Pseudomonas entomophila L48]